MKIQSIDALTKGRRKGLQKEEPKRNGNTIARGKEEEEKKQEKAVTVQFRGTEKSKSKNRNKRNELMKMEKIITPKCNLAAQFERGTNVRGIVLQHPNKCKRYVTKILKESFFFRKMAEKLITSTPRPTGAPEEREE